MAGLVGYNKVVSVKTTASTAYSAIPASQASLNFGAELLDDTDFTSTGYRSRVAGLRDYSINVSAFYATSNTALSAIRTALIGGTNLDVRYLVNGTAGFQGRVRVESFNNSGDVGGLETVEVTLQSNGTALTTV
jgi:predicted secreted protein